VWVHYPEGSCNWREVQHRPVWCSLAEACAFCRSRSLRLMNEAEHALAVASDPTGVRFNPWPQLAWGPHPFFCVSSDSHSDAHHLRSNHRHVAHSFVHSQAGMYFTPGLIAPGGRGGGGGLKCNALFRGFRVSRGLRLEQSRTEIANQAGTVHSAPNWRCTDHKGCAGSRCSTWVAGSTHPQSSSPWMASPPWRGMWTTRPISSTASTMC